MDISVSHNVYAQSPFLLHCFYYYHFSPLLTFKDLFSVSLFLDFNSLQVKRHRSKSFRLRSRSYNMFVCEVLFVSMEYMWGIWRTTLCFCAHFPSSLGWRMLFFRLLIPASGNYLMHCCHLALVSVQILVRFYFGSRKPNLAFFAHSSTYMDFWDTFTLFCLSPYIVSKFIIRYYWVLENYISFYFSLSIKKIDIICSFEAVNVKTAKSTSPRVLSFQFWFNIFIPSGVRNPIHILCCVFPKHMKHQLEEFS